MIVPASIPALYDAIRHDSLYVDEIVAGMRDDIDALGWFLHRTQQTRRDLQAIEQTIIPALVRAMPYGQPYILEGVGALTVKGGSRRVRYDQRQLVSAYSNRIRRGLPKSRTLTRAAVIEAACVVMAEATGVLAPSFSGWRTTTAKKFDIDLARYSEYETSPHTVLIQEP